MLIERRTILRLRGIKSSGLYRGGGVYMETSILLRQVFTIWVACLCYVALIMLHRQHNIKTGPNGAGYWYITILLGHSECPTREKQ